MRKWMVPVSAAILILLVGGLYFLFRPVVIEQEEPEEKRELPRREVENFHLFLLPQDDGFGLDLRGDFLVESPDGSYMDLTVIWGEIMGRETEGPYEIQAGTGYLKIEPEFLRLEKGVTLKSPFYTMEMGFLEWFGGDPTLYGGGGVSIQGEGFSGQGEKVELRDELETIFLQGDARLYIRREGDGVETP